MRELNAQLSTHKHRRGRRNDTTVIRRRSTRRSRRAERRCEYRAVRLIFSNFSPVETVWTSRLDSPHISYKQAVYSSTSNAVLLLGYLSIETLVRAGVLYEILHMMERENLMFLFETKVCENTYKCGEFFIFTSGVKGDKHGVGVILHVSLLSSVTAVQAYSSWQIAVQLKITGGRLTLLGIYCPHEGVDVETRERFFDELNEATTSYSKAGPVLACGDLNTFEISVCRGVCVFWPTLVRLSGTTGCADGGYKSGPSSAILLRDGNGGEKYISS